MDVDPTAVEKKLDLSLDDLIKQQATKRSTNKQPAKKATQTGKKVVVAVKAGGKKAGSAKKASAAVARVKAGGVKKGGGAAGKQAPKQAAIGGKKAGAGASKRTSAPPRVVKITIGNNKPGSSAGPRGAAAGSGYGAPPPGAALSHRYDRMHNAAPAGGPRPSGPPRGAPGPRRNAHGVVVPY